MNEWMNDWMNEWMNDWMNEWLNEWMTDRSIHTLLFQKFVVGKTFSKMFLKEAHQGFIYLIKNTVKNVFFFWLF